MSRVRETIGGVPAGGGRPPLSRARSARARLGEDPSAGARPGEDPDAEVHIGVEQRRGSSRRRLEHYARVLDELDRQADEGYSCIDAGELARVGRASSERSLRLALERGGGRDHTRNPAAGREGEGRLMR